MSERDPIDLRGVITPLGETFHRAKGHVDSHPDYRGCSDCESWAARFRRVWAEYPALRGAVPEAAESFAFGPRGTARYVGVDAIEAEARRLGGGSHVHGAIPARHWRAAIEAAGAVPEAGSREGLRAALQGAFGWSEGRADRHAEALATWLANEFPGNHDFADAADRLLRAALGDTQDPRPDRLDVDTLVVAMVEAVKRVAIQHGIRPTEFMDAAIAAANEVRAESPAAPETPRQAVDAYATATNTSTEEAREALGAAPETPRDQFAWLIERGQPEGRDFPEWWGVTEPISGAHGWSRDAWAGDRFPTREAAEEVIARLNVRRGHPFNARAVEHGFVRAGAAPETREPTP